jgi:hypothetical protein
VRQAGAVAVGVAIAALGALILGEYELDPVPGLVAGALLGFAVTEAALMTGGDRRLAFPSGVALAVAVFGAMVWAGWIDVHERNESIGVGALLGAAAGAGVVVLRTGRGSGRSGGSGSPPDPPRMP